MRVSPLVASLVVCALAGGDARAQSPAACIAANSDGQRARSDGKLRAAREAFIRCSSEACPGVVRKDCVERLDETNAAMPSILVAATDASGAPLSNAAVSIDGAQVADTLNGLAIPLDPGEHTLRVATADGRARDERIFVLEGEKHRRVSLTLGAPAKSARAEPPAAPPAQARGGVPVGAYVLGGAALLAVGAFGVLAAVGRGTEHDLSTSCAPKCTDADLAGVRRAYLVADVSLAASVALAAAAVIVAWPRAKGSASASMQVRAAPIAGGAVVGAGGAF